MNNSSQISFIARMQIYCLRSTMIGTTQSSDSSIDPSDRTQWRRQLISVSIDANYYTFNR